VGIEFSLLGPLMVRCDGRAVAVPGGKPRTVLAALLLDAGDLVTVDQLAEVLWGADLPASARVSVQNHVKRLRQALGEAGRARIATLPGGYVLHLEAGELDVSRFQNSLACAQAAARDTRWEQASEQASAALLLWHGEPLADAGSELLAQRAVPYLAEMRLRACEIRLEAQIRLGQPAEAIGELYRLTAAHPLREHLHALLILALQRCGRRGEALAAYQAARRILIDELGAEPGLELRQAHRHILTDDSDVAAAPDPVPPLADTCQTAVPRQLPAPAGDFVGRQAELAALTGALGHAVVSAPATLAISVIAGAAGVGKTALAVHWARKVSGQFPDGQLYVNLRGFGPSGPPVTAIEAVSGFLAALGVAPESLPPGLDARVGLYRSLATGKRLLIVLDNARDAAQVRPLLPSSSGCLVLVTSRASLTGLAVTQAAHLLILDVLSQDEAWQLLAARLGAQRVAAEPGVVSELITLTGRLSLALAVVAARACARPSFPLAVLAAELRDESGRLDALDAGEPASSLRAAFSWSYDQLSPAGARLFRLLGLHPGPDFTVHAMASLVGVSLSRARNALRELADASLITEQAPGRFACHDLLHAYAIEQTSTTGSQAGRHAARGRLLDYYLHTAAAADRLLYPHRHQITLAAPRPGVTLDVPGSHSQALAWLDAEHRGLFAAVTLAADHGFDVHAWQLAFSLETLFFRRGHWHDWAATQRTALAAAYRLGDQHAQALAHSGIANAQIPAGDLTDALSHLTIALRLREESGDVTGQARVHLYIGLALESQGRYRDALASSRQALRLALASGAQEKPAVADALNHVGWDLAKLGCYQQALSYSRRAVALSQQLDNRQLLPHALDSLAYVYWHLGRLAEAVGCYRRAVELFGETGERYRMARSLGCAGDAHHSDANLSAARQAWTQALAILDELNHPDADGIRAKLTALRSRK
jgi:DNA-binding SARP family transcriptional activator